MLESSITSLLNACLQADPEVAARLSEIDQCILKVHFREADLTRFIQIVGNEVVVHRQSERCDVSLDISIRALGGFLSGQEILDLIKQDVISVQGDTHIVSVFQRVLRAVDIDWEEIFARYSGDLVAHEIFKVIHASARVGRQFHAYLTESARDYAYEEARILPSGLEVQAFMQEVDDLRAAVDRLEARVERIANARQPV